MNFPTRTEYALHNNHKVGTLVRLNYHDKPRDPVYMVSKTKIHDQFAYSIKNFKTKKNPGGTWQHFQLIPLTPESDPEYFL